MRILDDGIQQLDETAEPSKAEVQKVFDKFNKCAKDCSVGAQEVFRMQRAHAEVTRLTYARSIARCLEIHADGATSAEALPDDRDFDLNRYEGLESTADQKVSWPELAHCIEHNTDKVDRRFFGYYSNQQMKLINKYSPII